MRFKVKDLGIDIQTEAEAEKRAICTPTAPSLCTACSVTAVSICRTACSFNSPSVICHVGCSFATSPSFCRTTCSFHSPSICHFGCSHVPSLCHAACSLDITVCHACTHLAPSACGPISPCGGISACPGGSIVCGGSIEPIDPVEPVQNLAALKEQLQRALEQVDQQQRAIDEAMQPQTVEDVNLLESKLQEALTALKERRAELERRAKDQGGESAKP